MVGTSAAIITAALLTPTSATASAPAPLGAVARYTGLSFSVPVGLDDMGRPQSCVIDADLYKPHAASTTNRVPTILTTEAANPRGWMSSGRGQSHPSHFTTEPTAG